MYLSADLGGRADLWVCRQQNGWWEPPQATDLPADPNEASLRFAPSLSPDGGTLYFTRGLIGDPLYFVDPRELFISDRSLWSATRADESWTAPQPLAFPIDTPDPQVVTTDPGISADGETLVFSSDRDGGSGKLDLWMSTREGDVWSQPLNLGPLVSSAADDRDPAFSADGNTLYFSSNRAGGFGNHDIWLTRKLQGQWTAPRNLGAGVNSAGDERGPYVSPDGWRLYFTGIRAGGEGFSDVWTAEFNCGAFDGNADGTIDAADFAHFHACAAGVQQPSSIPCSHADADGDRDVDLLDFAKLQACIRPTPR
jgi:Tol biopolymer transport system component